MESYAHRIAFLLIAFPIFLFVGWMGWDERIAQAAIGALAAFTLIGTEEENESESAHGAYLIFGIASLALSVFCAFVVRYLADQAVGLYQIATISSEWKSIRSLPFLPVTLAAFSIIMFIMSISELIRTNKKSDT